MSEPVHSSTSPPPSRERKCWIRQTAPEGTLQLRAHCSAARIKSDGEEVQGAGGVPKPAGIAQPWACDKAAEGGMGRRMAQWVPASKHRDLNLTPRIHVKRPGVALGTGHTETGGSPVAWLAASLLAELRASPETTSQKNEILKSGQHPRNDTQGCRPRTQPHIMKVQPIKFYPKVGAFICSFFYQP